MRVLDAASGLLSRLQELAVLGANNTNTTADHEAINNEAEAMADEFNRLMTTSTYKGKNIFVTTAASEYVSMGGRNSEMTFGIGTIAYTELYGSARTVAGGPSDAVAVNLAHLPSDAVAAKKYGANATNKLESGLTYEIVSMGTQAANVTSNDGTKIQAKTAATLSDGDMKIGLQFTVNADVSDLNQSMTFKRVSGTNDLTKDIEAVQAKVNTARVQAGSQYAAIESAVNYTTDLTAQYELGFNAVSDVNFSMETAHLAKNQILQQAATAMLAQANQGQQGLLQLIQG
jgi:flagellin